MALENVPTPRTWQQDPRCFGGLGDDGPRDTGSVEEKGVGLGSLGFLHPKLELRALSESGVPKGVPGECPGESVSLRAQERRMPRVWEHGWVYGGAVCSMTGPQLFPALNLVGPAGT